MRTMLYRVGSVFSLLIALAIAWCWIASYRTSHYVSREEGEVEWELIDGRGLLLIDRLTLLNPSAEEKLEPIRWTYRSRPATSLGKYANRSLGSGPVGSKLGFGWVDYVIGRFHHRRLILPYCFLFLLALILPAFSAIHRLAHRHEPQAHATRLSDPMADRCSNPAPDLSTLPPDRL
jgi:hypothetical protein